MLQNDSYWELPNGFISTGHEDRIAAARKQHLNKIKNIKVINMERQKTRYKQYKTLKREQEANRSLV